MGRFQATTLLFGLAGVSMAAQTLYVDATRGRDGCDGLSPETAWQSLDRVNSAPLGPGDKVRAGETVLDLSPDGLTIARTLDLSTVELVDIASNTVLHTIQQASGSYPVVSFSPDGEYLAVGNWQEALVADIYRVRDGSLLCVVEEPQGIWVASQSRSR